MNEAFTVSELNEFLKIAFDQSEILRDIYIKGEISNFTNHYKTGHYYFTIKDESSALKAVMFRMYTRGIGFIPENGMKIIAHGKIDVFVRDGTYSLKVDDIVPDGVGSVYVSFEQLKNKLEKEGLFDVEHKKEIPGFPSKIGVLTSATGAVIRDIVNVSSRRYPLCEIDLYPCSVQGENAVKQLIQGLRYFEQTDVDTVIIARGGGSIEDLMPFNDEKLAREIFKCEKPIISAVGHETDFTICDFVSDLRAPTPSAAAELALPSADEIRNKLKVFKKNIDFKISNMLSIKIATLEKSANSHVLSKPFAKVEEMNCKLLEVTASLRNCVDGVIAHKELMLSNEKLKDHIERICERKENNLHSLVVKADALSPLAVLARGYSLVVKDEKIISSADELSEKDNITIRMNEGYVKAEVKEVEQG